MLSKRPRRASDSVDKKSSRLASDLKPVSSIGNGPGELELKYNDSIKMS